MVSKNDFEAAIISLSDNEVDKVIVCETLSKFCDKSMDAIREFVSFKILRAISSSEEIIRGFINFEDMTASVELDLKDNKYIMKSLNKIY